MKRLAIATLCGALVLTVGMVAAQPPAYAAHATVGNGLTTTDLNAVGMSASSLASALVGSGVSVSNATFTGSASFVRKYTATCTVPAGGSTAPAG